MIIILSVTRVSYVSDGTQTTFSFPFDYLRKAFVTVSVNKVDLTYGVDYTVNNKEVLLAVAKAPNTKIIVERKTPTEALVGWHDASVLTAKDMTVSQVQQLHILEEQNTYIQVNGIFAENKVWQGQGHRLANIADPTEPQDVVTLNYVNANETGLLTKLATATTAHLKSLADNFNTYTASLKADFDRYTASLLTDFNSYTQNLLADITTYKADLLKLYTDYKADLLSNYNTYNTTLSGYVATAKTYMETTLSYRDTTATNTTTTQGYMQRAETAMNTCESMAGGKVVLKVDYDTDRATDKTYVDTTIEQNVPTGCGKLWFTDTAPTGWLICDGSTISRTVYAKLFAVIGDKYGTGDGTTTFALPDFRDRTPQGASTTYTIGTAISSGLPNIVGNAGGFVRKYTTSSGALIADGDQTWDFNITTASSAKASALRFDAGAYNPIYKNNFNKVQTPALAINFIIKY